MNHLINALVIISSMFILSACNNDVEDVNHKADHSTFAYNKVEVVSFQTMASNPDWPNLKDRAIVNLSVCLIDTAYQESIVGEEFSIESDVSSSSDETNISGCLNWTEEFSFNSLNDENYYIVSGKIIGRDHHKGEKVFSIALNPWTRSGVDLKSGRIGNSISIDSKMFKSVSKSLEVSRVNVDIIERKYTENSSNLKLKFKTTPEIVRRDIRGGIVKETLSGGQFKLNSYLISKNIDSEAREIIASSQNYVYVGHNGMITTEISLDLMKGLKPKNRLEFGFELVAENDMIGSDGGVIGISNLIGATSADVNSIGQGLSNLVKQQKDLYFDLNPEDIGFSIDRVLFSKGSQTFNNQSGVDREVAVEFELKMVDSLINDDIISHSFEVDIIDNKTGNVILPSDRVNTLRSSGALIVRAKIPYLAYSDNSWKELKIRVQSLESPYEGLVKERIVYLNPVVDGKDFGIDSAVGTPDLNLADNTPEIFIQSFDYEFIDKSQKSFKLNRDLEMSFTHTMNIQMSPKLKTKINVNGDKQYPDILTGDYRMRFLVLAPKDPLSIDYTEEINLDDYYTLTGAETEVQAENGLISHDVNLPFLFKELVFFNLKNVVLIELSPLDSRLKLKTGYFVGTIKGHLKKDTVDKRSSSGKKLSTGNLNIAKTLLGKLEQVKHKLTDDRYLGDSYEYFLNKLRDVKQEAVVFDYAKLSTKVLPVKMNIYKTEREFKRKTRARASESEISAFISDQNALSKTLTEDLCHQLYNKNLEFKQYFSTGHIGGAGRIQELKTIGYEYKNCVNDPSSHISVKQLEHVNKVLEQPKFVSVLTESLDRSVAYFSSKGLTFSDIEGVRKTKFTQHGFNFHLGLEGNPLKKVFPMIPAFVGGGYGFSAGTRTDIFTSNQVAQISSNLKRLINSSGSTFAVDTFNMRFDAEVRSCVMISGKYHSVKKPRKHEGAHSILMDDEFLQTSSDNQIYLCKANYDRKLKEENWYFVKLKKQSNVADDSLMRNTRMQIIRGDANFAAYRDMQINKDSEFVFVESEIAEGEQDNAAQRYMKYMDDRNRGAKYKSADKVGIGFPGLME